MPSLRDIALLQTDFLRIINKYNILDKIPLDHGAGCQLYPAEMHILEAIGRTPGVTVTALAESQGVTKGAVSQTVKKLLAKGLVEKRPGQSDAKVRHLSLTERGKLAHDGHHRFHARYDGRAVSAMLELSDHDFAVLRRFLDLTESTLDAYLADLAPRRPGA